jgi:hypothetical protein
MSDTAVTCRQMITVEEARKKWRELVEGVGDKRVAWQADQRQQCVVPSNAATARTGWRHWSCRGGPGARRVAVAKGRRPG